MEMYSKNLETTQKSRVYSGPVSQKESITKQEKISAQKFVQQHGNGVKHRGTLAPKNAKFAERLRDVFICTFWLGISTKTDN